MRDIGDGDLDMTSGDGLYSAWLTSGGDGRYVTRVRAEAGLQTGVGTRTSFTRSVRGPVLQLRDTANLAPVPLLRVMDLSVTSNVSGILQLTWTSHATDLSYAVLHSPSLEDLILTSSPHRQVLMEVNVSRPEAKVKLSVPFPYYGRPHYLAVTSAAPGHALSPISNIVTITQTMPRSRLGPGDPGQVIPALSDPLSLGSLTHNQWIVVGAVAGLVSVLLCLSAVLLVWLHWTRTRPPAPPTITVSSSSSDSSDTTDTLASYDLDLKPGDLSRDSRDSVTCPRVTPVYWSASQLLSKLDTRHVAPSYQGVHPRPQDIPDAFCVTVSDLSDLSDQSQGTFIKDYEDYQKDDSFQRPILKKQPPPVLPKPKNITQV